MVAIFLHAEIHPGHRRGKGWCSWWVKAGVLGWWRPTFVCLLKRLAVGRPRPSLHNPPLKTIAKKLVKTSYFPPGESQATFWKAYLKSVTKTSLLQL